MRDRLYEVALSLVPRVGGANARALVSYCGSAEQVFKTPKVKLLKIPGIGPQIAEYIVGKKALETAEAELTYIEKQGIQVLFYTDPGFPQLLKHCMDAPALLYMEGEVDLNARKIIGIVGTRKATTYGKEVTASLVEGLAPLNPLIISGLAYGIDGEAHRAALDNGLHTVGVVGHGLDNIYPPVHHELARTMTRQGALLTEYPSKTKLDPGNFPSRNRIVAGICHAIVVVESDTNGGALITADIANSYDRDVFAVPGRINSRYSRGTNYLIRTNRAVLLDEVDTLIQWMNWDLEEPTQDMIEKKEQLLSGLSAIEQLIVDYLKKHDEVHIDELSAELPVSDSQLSATLLELEFKGLLRTKPGNMIHLLL